MPFQNRARRIWNTLWTRSTGLEASCRNGIFFLVNLSKFYTIPMCCNAQNKHALEVVFPNVRKENCIWVKSIEELKSVYHYDTHPAQAEDMQWVRELSSRLVFSNSAAFTLIENEIIMSAFCIWKNNFNFRDKYSNIPEIQSHLTLLYLITCHT